MGKGYPQDNLDHVVVLSEVSGITDVDQLGRKMMRKGFGLLTQNTEGVGSGMSTVADRLTKPAHGKLQAKAVQ